MLEQIQELAQQGVLEDSDYQFARFMEHLHKSSEPALVLGSALVSQATRNGHVCLDLSAVAGLTVLTSSTGAPLVAPDLPSWVMNLAKCRVVASPGDLAPLILDPSGRLYLYRYWEYEQRLSKNIKDRATRKVVLPDTERFKDQLNRFFPENDVIPNWQKISAAISVLKHFVVISGGPGTGKTSTVARILALLESLQEGESLRIALAAPTGKAAARLAEAMQLAKDKMDCEPEILEAIPDTASTLHRLLGYKPNSVNFRHGIDNPLPLDVVVVDEASMTDVALMTKLVEALPRKCRLILLGDRDQLASVAAGAVLSDICAIADDFSTDFSDLLTPIIETKLPIDNNGSSLVRDSVVILRHSYRFGSDSGIGMLASAVNAGNGDSALSILNDDQYFDTAFLAITSATEFEKDLLGEINEKLCNFWKAIDDRKDPREVLARFNDYRLLCAHRNGPFSVSHINELITTWVKHRDGISVNAEWYPGRPVMISRNDQSLRLFNGDIGVSLPDPDNTERLLVYFESSDGTIRSFSPGRLPDHETVYAMTVHKSQGS